MLQEWLLGTWYGDSRRGSWLLPLAWLFGILTRLRHRAYRYGVFPSYRSRRPVVVVGNLTVGGTGKTPLVMWLAGALAARGLRPGIASRGYRGSGGAARLLTDADDAVSAGDEAILLYRRLQMPVAVAARRADAVRLLEPLCDLVLTDDGLQHYALQRDFEIAVVDGARGLGNGRLLPAGPLREARQRLHEVDAVVVNGSGFSWPGAATMELLPVAAVALAGGERRPLGAFGGHRVRAIAGIGNPARFFEMLRGHGLILDELALPDHAAIPHTALVDGSARQVLITEKDAVKCAGDGLQHVWYVEIGARVAGAAASRIVERVVALVRNRDRGT